MDGDRERRATWPCCERSNTLTPRDHGRAEEVNATPGGDRPRFDPFPDVTHPPEPSPGSLIESDSRREAGCPALVHEPPPKEVRYHPVLAVVREEPNARLL